MAHETELRAVGRAGAPMPVRRVRKAYEQVADQLRELIVRGELEQGARLPTETLLAGEFGVSRATVREALRLLAAQNLVRTTKGATGGSYVTLPTLDHISAFLHSSINLLTEAEDVSLEELLEARELLEVPAARLAARRRAEDDVARLRASIPGDPLRLSTQEQFTYNKDFHSIVLESCGNTLLHVAAQPIFTVLQTNLARSVLGRRFHRAINDHHHGIVAAIQEGDERAAGEQMHEHLAFLRPFYERAWRATARTRAKA